VAASETVLIVGAGSGLSASLAKLCAAEGMKVALAARDIEKLRPLAAQTGAQLHRCDASDAAAVSALFAKLDDDSVAPDLVVYNASGRYRGAIDTLEAEKLAQAVAVTALGGFHVAQAAAIRMLARGKGSILLTGATASVKGLPGSTPFAMGKFALRGMAQCLARELAPRNIHVAHFIIDGGIGTTGGRTEAAGEDKWLDPDAIAREYLHIHRQHRSAWTWEVELRPWVETF
jgi:NAD(P)-dependent dehydrogenase (short-subunit alcohol dehydrogenase family)